MQILITTHRRLTASFLFAAALLLILPVSHAADTFKWTVQYLIDNSQTTFGRSQKVFPRRNRGLALSPDGKFLYAAYHRAQEGAGGEIRKLAVGITDDYGRATVRVLTGPTGKALATDDKGRVYICNESEILIYDANLDQILHTVPAGNPEGVATAREGKDLVLYATDRQLGLIQRWVMEEKGDGIAGASPAGFEGNGQFAVEGARSLRGIDIDAQGNLWVADNEAGRVIRVSKDGKKAEAVTDLSNVMDIAVDGARTYITRGKDRLISVVETDTLKIIGNLAVPWEELELSPIGNNSTGALCGIVAIPGKGFYVSNEGGQTARQKSTYGKADKSSEVINGKLYRDAFMDDNEPLLRAQTVGE